MVDTLVRLPMMRATRYVDMGGEVAKWVVVRPLGSSSEATTGMLDRAVSPVVVVRLMSKVACRPQNSHTSDVNLEKI